MIFIEPMTSALQTIRDENVWFNLNMKFMEPRTATLHATTDENVSYNLNVKFMEPTTLPLRAPWMIMFNLFSMWSSLYLWLHHYTLQRMMMFYSIFQFLTSFWVTLHLSPVTFLQSCLSCLSCSSFVSFFLHFYVFCFCFFHFIFYWQTDFNYLPVLRRHFTTWALLSAFQFVIMSFYHHFIMSKWMS